MAERQWKLHHESVAYIDKETEQRLERERTRKVLEEKERRLIGPEREEEEGATLIIEECLSRESAAQIIGQTLLRTDGAGTMHGECGLEDAGSCKK